MNKFGKATLLAGASALALGLAASQASAFDDVDWEWDTNIKEKINLYIDPSFWQLDPRGLVQVEQLQISIGDIKATSEVKHVYNDVGMTYGDPETVDIYVTGYAKGTLDVETDVKTHVATGVYTKVGTDVYGKAVGPIDVYGKAKDDCWWGRHGKKCDYDPVKAGGYADLDVYGHGKGYGVGFGYGKGKGYGKGTAYGKLDVKAWGTAEIPVIVPNTIDDLAHIVSTATAIANVATVEGNSAVFVHDGQFAIGDVGYGKDGHQVPRTSGDAVALVDDSDYGHGGYYHYDPVDNTHHDLVGVALIAAALGLVDKADISAESKVFAIENASIDSDATAIANVHSIDVEAELATDVMVVSDLTQFSYADVTATSKVGGIYIDHFEGLGGLEDGLVNSVATAIGNVSSVNVSVGGVEAASE
jgi:hypothetical protein